MENISTGLKWVIGMIVTILIVAAGVSIYLIINNYFIRAQEQTLTQTEMINQAEFSSYDNKRVSGQDVTSAAMRYKGRPQLSIIIKTGLVPKGFHAENTYGAYYTLATPKTDTEDAKAIDFTNKTSSVSDNDFCTVSEMLNQSAVDENSRKCNINTLSTFKATLHRDKNGEVRIIEFNQNPED